jgi:anti-sigma B factor antagonist
VLATPVLPAAPEPGQLLSVTAVPGDRPGLVTVAVVGEVDTSTAPLLQLCLDSRTDQPGLRELVIDLERVTSLGAAGVAALSRAHRRCARRGVRVVLRCAGRRCVLDARLLTDLTDLVGIDPVGSIRRRPRAGRTATRPRPTPWRPQQRAQSGR